MRIAYLLQCFPVLTETFIRREIDALERLGARVDIFALQHPADPVLPESRALVDRTRYLSPLWPHHALAAHALWARNRPAVYRAILRRVFRNPRPVRAFYRFSQSLVAASAMAPCRVDHLHAHFASPPADAAALVGELLGIPFTVSIHAYDVFAQPASSLRGRLNPAAAVFACSQAALDAAASACPEVRSRLHLVHHGIPLPPAPTAPIQDNPTRLLSLGRLEPKKGLSILIEACRLLRDQNVPFSLTIAGDGSERAALQEQIATAHLSDGVTLRGPVTQESAAALFRESTLLVVPSVVTSDGDRDGIPNAILEAMAAGLPVLATRVGGIPEVVRDGDTGFLTDPGRPDLMAERLRSLLAEPATRRRVTPAARHLMEEVFDLPRNAEALLQLFQRYATRHPPEMETR